MGASSQNTAGASWSGTAQMTSYDTMGQMNRAFHNIVNMLHGMRHGRICDADNYEQQEQASQHILCPATQGNRRLAPPRLGWRGVRLFA
jgi:uncharacterized protein YukE